MTKDKLNNAEVLLGKANSHLRSAQTALDKFTAELAKNPAYALEWSRDAFRAAASKQVWESMKLACENAIARKFETLTPETIVEVVKAEATREVVRRASSIANTSTSQTGNLMNSYLLEVWAEVLEELRWMA